MSVLDGTAKDDCPCVSNVSKTCNAEEGIYPGVEVLTAYSKLGGCQFIIGLLGTAAGVVTVSLSASNVSWLFVNGLPFLSGVLIMIAGYFAWRVGRVTFHEEVKTKAKFFVIANYVASVVGCTLSGISIGLSRQGLSSCLSHESGQYFKCTPYKDTRKIFFIFNIIFAVLQLILNIIGSVVFYRHAASFGFPRRNRALQRDMTTAKHHVTMMQTADQLNSVDHSTYTRMKYSGYKPFATPSYGELSTDFGCCDNGKT